MRFPWTETLVIVGAFALFFGLLFTALSHRADAQESWEELFRPVLTAEPRDMGQTFAQGMLTQMVENMPPIETAYQERYDELKKIRPENENRCSEYVREDYQHDIVLLKDDKKKRPQPGLFTLL